MDRRLDMLKKYGVDHIYNEKMTGTKKDRQELFSGSAKRFNVIITEKLQKIITVEAESREEAEQIVSDKWNDSQYILDAENFVDVEFASVLSG